MRGPGTPGAGRSLEEVVKRTPFYEIHKALGARLIDFGEWKMPVQYTSILEEHRAVRTSVGLFDVSHMGEITAVGPQAAAFTQYLITNDINRCAVGQAVYTAMCKPHGGIVDDLIAYRRGENDFFFCVNAANTAKDFAWMKTVAADFDVVVENRSDQYAQLAVQGPKAEEVVQGLVPVDLSGVGFYHFVETEVVGVPALVSRTGYTGEDGFELYFDPSEARKVWEAVMQAGQPHGIRPVGLGARDTLRLEMKFALYGNDIDETTDPLEAGLGWIVKLDKGDFVGRDALLARKESGLTRRLIGFELLDRGVPRHGYRALDPDGRLIGHVTSGAFSPSLEKPIGMAYLKRGHGRPGTRFLVEIRKKQVPAVVVKTPFYKPPARRGT